MIIKFVFDKEIKENHKFLCPNCNYIFDLISKAEINKVPDGLALKIHLYSDPMKKFHTQATFTPLSRNTLNDSSLREIEIMER